MLSSKGLYEWPQNVVRRYWTTWSWKKLLYIFCTAKTCPIWPQYLFKLIFNWPPTKSLCCTLQQMLPVNSYIYLVVPILVLHMFYQEADAWYLRINYSSDKTKKLWHYITCNVWQWEVIQLLQEVEHKLLFLYSFSGWKVSFKQSAFGSSKTEY